MSRKHTSLISLVISKAFDRVGVRTIVDQHQEWNIGPKIISKVKNYMLSRKIIVRVGLQI